MHGERQQNLFPNGIAVWHKKGGRMINHPPVRHRGSLCRDAMIDRGNIITKEELLTLCP